MPEYVIKAKSALEVEHGCWVKPEFEIDITRSIENTTKKQIAKVAYKWHGNCEWYGAKLELDGSMSDKDICDKVIRDYVAEHGINNLPGIKTVNDFCALFTTVIKLDI